MDFNELLHKLERVRVINRQLAEKLEQAQKKVLAYREFSQNDEISNLDSSADQSSNVGSHYRLYTMGSIGNPDIIRAALEILNVYDGIQFMIAESDQDDAVLKMGQITRHGKFPGKSFTTRRNSKGVIVWRID